MNLSDYFAKEHGAQARLSKVIEIPASLLSVWASGNREIPIGRCMQLETATKQAVMRWDLRPGDWHLIWPELKNSKLAPLIKPELARRSKAKAEA